MIIERKHRLNRELYRGFVRIAFTVCTDRRRNIFVKENTEMVNLFISILKKAADGEKADILIYVFMPDHIHFVAEGKSRDSDLWKMMKMFKQMTGWELKKLNNGMQWQKDYYDHILRKNTELFKDLKYIADNPVRKGIIERWEKYQFTGSFVMDLKKIFE